MALNFPRRHAAWLAATVAVLAAMIVAVAPAAATPASGKATLSFAKQGKKHSLSALGVKVTSPKRGKAKTSRKSSSRRPGTVKLTISDLSGSTATVDDRVRFARGKRGVTVGGIRLAIGAKSVSLSGKLGGKRINLLRAKGATKVGENDFQGRKLPLSLTGRGAKALAAKLGVTKVAAGRVGTFAIDAKAETPAPQPPVVTPPAPKPPEPPKPPVDPYPYSSECPVASVEGGPPFDGPGQVEGTLPLPTFLPGSVQAVTGASTEWGLLQSFRNYVLNAPPPGSLQALEGATAVPSGTGMEDADAFFDFPVGAGSYERGTEPDHDDDKLVADATGTVLFCKSGHGFNVVVQNPTVVIDGDDSRIVADVGANFHGTWYPVQRVDFAALDLSAVEAETSDSGNAITWSDVPTELTEDGATALGLDGFYQAGDALDPITVEATLDRPLLAECPIDAGIAASPPDAKLTLSDGPIFNDPIVGGGDDLGTINWGFRPSLRASTAGAGSFQLLDGAEASYPNMGGPNEPAPDGRIGKFFRFPISEYVYDAAGPGGSDDLLLARSDATVGLCNPAAGNFGVVISKPTIIIEGENSRIEANVYSFAGSFMGGPASGWIGGRTDLVDLDESTIEAVEGSGSVLWGEAPADETPLTNGIAVDGGLQTEALSIVGLTEGGGEGGFDPIGVEIELPNP